MKKLILIILFIFLSLKGFAYDPHEQKWVDEYVVGDIKDIPNKSIRDYLLATHHNNPYAEKIKEANETLGPFSPNKDNVFWLPHIDVPVDPKNWRFMSDLDGLPEDILEIGYGEKDGKLFARLFIHPFSTDRSHFIELAAKHGGFKFEHQAATTASVRSFISWQTKEPRGDINTSGIDFPDDKTEVFKTKVSVYGVDIDGSRLNPAKKMVRAFAVTRLFDEIPESVKTKVGFDFEGEWVAAVPDSTNAGYVIRKGLPEITGETLGVTVEPGFSVLSAKRMTELYGDMTPTKAKKAIQKELINSLATSTMYLAFEEGMIGENHSQNFDYVLGDNGRPNGRVLYHDADAFRTSIILRSLNGKSLRSLDNIDHPFFYAKDSTFQTTQNAKGEAYTLNTLMDYMVDQFDDTSMVSMLFDWCKDISKFSSWCAEDKIRYQLQEAFANEASQYLNKPVDPYDFGWTGGTLGKKGMINLMNERIDLLKKKLGETEFDPRIQELLSHEYHRLQGIGLGRKMGTTTITMENTKFYLNRENGNYSIVAMGNSKKHVLRGIVLLEGGAKGSEKFLEKIELKTTGEVQEKTCAQLLTSLAGAFRTKGLAQPIMRNMGGGSNIR